MSSIIATLKGLSSAEDFFRALDIAYDEKTLSVCRLHILKRMGLYLGELDADALDEARAKDSCRAFLQRAYAEFESKSPIETRLFKVLKDRDPTRPEQKGRVFVPLSDLTG